jgi:hypothetical protein
MGKRRCLRDTRIVRVAKAGAGLCLASKTKGMAFLGGASPYTPKSLKTAASSAMYASKYKN